MRGRQRQQAVDVGFHDRIRRAPAQTRLGKWRGWRHRATPPTRRPGAGLASPAGSTIAAVGSRPGPARPRRAPHQRIHVAGACRVRAVANARPALAVACSPGPPTRWEGEFSPTAALRRRCPPCHALRPAFRAARCVSLLAFCRQHRGGQVLGVEGLAGRAVQQPLRRAVQPDRLGGGDHLLARAGAAAGGRKQVRLACRTASMKRPTSSGVIVTLHADQADACGPPCPTAWAIASASCCVASRIASAGRPGPRNRARGAPACCPARCGPGGRTVPPTRRPPASRPRAGQRTAAASRAGAGWPPGCARRGRWRGYRRRPSTGAGGGARGLRRRFPWNWRVTGRHAGGGFGLGRGRLDRDGGGCTPIAGTCTSKAGGAVGCVLLRRLLRRADDQAAGRGYSPSLPSSPATAMIRSAPGNAFRTLDCWPPPEGMRPPSPPSDPSLMETAHAVGR